MAENKEFKLSSFSSAVSVPDPKLAADFYVSNFSGHIKFDCGWYIVVEIDGQDICFSKPQNPEDAYKGGLTLNFEVSDVDAEYERLQSLGLDICCEPKDYEWGHRALFLSDKMNIGIYIYSLGCPVDEKFKNAIL